MRNTEKINTKIHGRGWQLKNSSIRSNNYMSSFRFKLEWVNGMWQNPDRIRMTLTHPVHGDLPIDIHAKTRSDLDSVPREVPILYSWLKNRTVMGAFFHDWMYTHAIDRKVADDFFLMIMGFEKVKHRYRYPIYWGVRIFGSIAYNKKPAVIRKQLLEEQRRG